MKVQEKQRGTREKKKRGGGGGFGVEGGEENRSDRERETDRNNTKCIYWIRKFVFHKYYNVQKSFNGIALDSSSGYFNITDMGDNVPKNHSFCMSAFFPSALDV